jgi:hypothetical protein
LINQFKEKLPSLKDLKLIFRGKDINLISESMKRECFVQLASKARFSSEVSQEEDFINDNSILYWIAKEQDFKISITQKITRTSKDDICSDF